MVERVIQKDKSVKEKNAANMFLNDWSRSIQQVVIDKKILYNIIYTQKMYTLGILQQKLCLRNRL